MSDVIDKLEVHVTFDPAKAPVVGLSLGVFAARSRRY